MTVILTMTLFSVVKRIVIVHGMMCQQRSPSDTPNQILLRGKVLGDHVCDTLEHFCQTYEYNEIGHLLLTVLDK